MSNEEIFKKKFEEQKVIIWKNNYINYDLLKVELESIIPKNKEDIKEQIIENKNIKEINPEYVMIKMGDDEMSAKEEKLEMPNEKNNNAKNEKKTIEISLNMPIINFINFFKAEESQLYTKINTQISNYMNSKKKNDKNIEILQELEYLSKLCKELLNYVYLNIITLLRILNKFDNMFTNISYDYIKKVLSNGKLTYILRFIIIDKSLASLEDILVDIEKSLENNNYFKNNKNEENKFKENKSNIINNIKESNYIYEKIFAELNAWEKYLNINVGLSTSSHESVFANTSFIGDSILLSGNDVDRNRKKKLNYFEVDENLNNNIDNNGNDILGINSKENIIVDFGVLFDPLDTFSYQTNKVLSTENSGNLQLIIYLVGFYSYSYILLVPDIIIFLYDYVFSDIDPLKNPPKEELYLYGVAISIPLIGNVITKIFYEKYFYKFSFQCNLIFSLIFIALYYILFYLGVIFNESILNIILIIVGRFFLGLSYLKQISKKYIDNYVPRTNLIRANEKYNYSMYIGYILGLLINSLGYFKWKPDDKFHSKVIYISIIIGLSINYCIVMLISICIQFKELHNNNLYTKKMDLIIKNKNDNNQNNILDNNKSYEEDEDNESKNENDEKHLLTNFINKNRKKKGKYYKIIFFILLVNLFTSQYIGENLLLLLPRLVTYNYLKYMNDDKKEKSNYLIIFPIISSFSYLISYFLQRIYLKNSYYINRRKYIIILILIFMIIFTLSLSFLCIDLRDYDLNYYNIFPTIGFFLLIFTNEFFHTTSINFFIRLLPTEKFIIGYFSASTLINIITKIARLIPSILFFTYFFFYKIQGEKERDNIFIDENGDTNYFNDSILKIKFNMFNLYIFGIQLVLLVLNLIAFIIFGSYMTNSSVNRLLIHT